MSTAPRMTLAFLATTFLLAACAGKDAGKPSGATPAAGAASTTPGGAARDSGTSMPGMAGAAAAATGLADSMQAHFRAADAMNVDQLKSALPAHRELIANTLSRMNADMRQMNMPADPAWTALVDSIRQDLVHLPDLNGGELKQFMPRHGARVARLVQMHQQMMKNMKM